MKIIEGTFGKKETQGRTLSSKVSEALESIGPAAQDENQNIGFILITDVDSNIYVASDLPAETFNFLLDTAKMNIMLSSTVMVE